MKNVILKRQCTLVLGPTKDPLRCGDYAVISNADYDRFKDWFQLIEDVPEKGDSSAEEAPEEGL